MQVRNAQIRNRTSRAIALPGGISVRVFLALNFGLLSLSLLLLLISL